MKIKWNSNADLLTRQERIYAERVSAEQLRGRLFFDFADGYTLYVTLPDGARIVGTVVDTEAQAVADEERAEHERKLDELERDERELRRRRDALANTDRDLRARRRLRPDEAQVLVDNSDP